MPMEITYDQGSEFIGHEFRKPLTEYKYGILAKKSVSGNPTSNSLLERIHQVMVNLVWTCNIKETYMNQYDPWSVNLSAAAFAIIS